MEAMAHSELAKLSLDLKALNAKPLWERTARMGPGSPAVPTIWRYRDMRPQLLRSIELITAKEAERRVFMLENPGLPGTGYITNSLYCGLQVIKPGEIAPAHRHSPNALRFIIEGEGAYSTVEGERVPMHPGDFVLTPGWTWHDHGHLGSEPVIWLDALDNPFGQFFGAIFRENYPGETHPVSEVEGAAAARYGSNLMPVEYRPQRRASPLLVYPYDRTREALDRVARNAPLHPAHGAKMRYANPNDGGYAFPDAGRIHSMDAEGILRPDLSQHRRCRVQCRGGAWAGAHRGNRLCVRAARCLRGAAVDALLHRDRERMRPVQLFRSRCAGGARLLARARSGEYACAVGAGFEPAPTRDSHLAAIMSASCVILIGRPFTARARGWSASFTALAIAAGAPR